MNKFEKRSGSWTCYAIRNFSYWPPLSRALERSWWSPNSKHWNWIKFEDYYLGKFIEIFVYSPVFPVENFSRGWSPMTSPWPKGTVYCSWDKSARGWSTCIRTKWYTWIWRWGNGRCCDEFFHKYKYSFRLLFL